MVVFSVVVVFDLVTQQIGFSSQPSGLSLDRRTTKAPHLLLYRPSNVDGTSQFHRPKRSPNLYPFVQGSRPHSLRARS